MMEENGGGFREAMERGEVVPFLRGDGGYRRVPKSDFAGEDAPTDSWLVLQEIYGEAKEDNRVGEVLSDALCELLEGTAGDVYLAVLYLVRLALAEQGGRLPLEIPLKELLLQAKECVRKNQAALSGELAFSNGFVKKEALADIQGWSEAVFRQCYGVDMVSL